MKKWNLDWSFNYSSGAEGIEAETKEEAIEIAYQFAKADFEDNVECFAEEADESA